MTVLLFVLFWIVVALGLLFLAMSGGPQGMRRRLQPQGRRGRRGATALFVATIAVLGIGVPAAVIAAERNRRSAPEANLSELTPEQQHGRELFGLRCRNCHSLTAANANAKIGPNLDEPPRSKALVLNAIQNGRAQGNGNMPADIFEGRDAEAVASFVAAASGGQQ